MSGSVFRLFVSSPGDVAAERVRLEAVVEKLNAEFKDRARFDAVRWETNFYSAHETFQRQIPEAAECDLVVAIFRARLGSPLPQGFEPQADGGPYPSGTAYEVLSAIAKRREGGPLPDIYVFRYPHDPQVSLNAADRADIESQWRALEGFFERWFKTAGGQFVAGFQPYESTDDFAERIEECLRQWLAKRGISARETWDRTRFGSPFPGLAAFGADRESVFFGRDLAIRQATERLRGTKTPFLLILGASGAGKSSLLRAGLMPRLARPGAIPEIDVFRPALMTPGIDPFAELAEALLAPDALRPELAGGRFADKDALSHALRGDPATAAALIGEALDKAAEARRGAAHFEKPRPARLLIGVDQAERLFTEASKDADAFAALLQALAGGVAYIIMAMRADAYARFQACAPLLALRARGATFDLIPPTAAELEEIVARPVAACEPPLAFGESDPPLGQRLVADAQGGDALPLLQMTLERLYKAQEARGDGILRAEDYKGMAAAVTETADDAMAHLGAGGSGALDALVAGLVADVAPDPVTAEPLPVVVALDRDAFLRGKPDRAALVGAFVESRLLTLEGGARLRPTHDALLRIWPDAAKRVAEMAGLIRARHALVPLAEGWAEAPPGEKPGHLQLSAPLLASGQQLEDRFGEDLGEPLRRFIASAEKADAARRARETRRARMTIAASFIVALGMAGLAAWAFSQRNEAIDARNDAVAQRAVAVAAKTDADQQRIAALESAKEANTQKAAALEAQQEAEKQRAAALENATEANKQKAAAEHNLALATDAANSLVFDIAQKFHDVSGVPASLIKSVLDRARDLQDKLLSGGQSNPDLLRSEAEALEETSRTLTTLGDSAGAFDTARKALGIFEELKKQRPESTDYQRELSVAHERVGDVEISQGQLAQSLESYRASLAIAESLAKSDPSNAGWQSDLASFYQKIGDIEVGQGELAQALDSYRSSLTIRERLAKSDPGNTGWQRNLSLSYDKLGGAEVAQGQLAQALDSYRASLAIAETLAKSDPSNANWQHDLSVSYEEIGGVEVAQGQLTQALESYRRSLAIHDRLAKSDPGNTVWQLGLSVGYQDVGNVEVAQGELAQALESYRADLAISESLATSDPSNADWQSGLAVAYEKVGGVELDQGHLAQALQSYRAEFAIDDHLAKSDPGNTGWQRGLSVAYEKVGDVEVGQGQLAQALESYRAEFEILDSLAKSDPSNAGWQSDLSVAYEKVGGVELDQGQLPQALESYRANLAIRERLAKSDPSNASWQRDLSVAYEKVGGAEVAQGQLAQALESYRAEFEILDSLAKSDPSNAGWQRSLSVAYQNVGGVELVQGQFSQALDSYRAALAIGERLASSDSTNADRRRDLSVSNQLIGDVEFQQGQIGEALESYRAGLEIVKSLASSDSTNASWQHDLSVAYQKVGDAEFRQGMKIDMAKIQQGLKLDEGDVQKPQEGQLAQALDSYRASLAIAETLAKSDPSDANWQDLLSTSYEKIGAVEAVQGQVAQALESYHASFAITERLAKSDPSNAERQRNLAISYLTLGSVYGAQNDNAKAREALEAGRAIIVRLAELSPQNAVLKNLIPFFDSMLATITP